MFEIFYFQYDIYIDDSSKNLFESHVKLYAPIKRINMHDIYKVEGNFYWCKKKYASEYTEVILKEIKQYA